MKFFLIYYTLCVIIFGDRLNTQSNWNVSNQLNNYIVNIKKEKIITNNFNDYIIYTALQTNIDYKIHNMYIQITPYIYLYKSSSGSQIRGNDTKFKKIDIFFRSLYYKYNYNSHNGIGLGILPFSNSAFMEFNNDYISDGEGLSTLNDSDLLSLFYTHTLNDSSIILGVGTLNTGSIPMGHYNNKISENMNSIFIIFKKKYNKWNYIYESTYDEYFYNNIYIGHSVLTGMGISWDDSEFSGWSFYNINGISYLNSKLENAQHMIITDNNIKKNDINTHPLQFAFDNKQYYGGSTLFGIRKDLDILSFDTMLNIEWFHTFSDWMSHNKGSPYNSNCNQMYSIRNNSYYVNVGININTNILLKINYTFLEFNELGKIGADLDTLPTNEKLYGERINKTKIIKIELKYKF